MKRFGTFVFVLLTACGGAGDGDAGRAAADGPVTLEVVGLDFAFDPTHAEIPAGDVEITLKNQGQQPHQIEILKLAEGVSFNEFRQHVMSGAGGITSVTSDSELVIHTPAGAGETVTGEAVALEAGEYALVCWIRDQSGRTTKNHAELGMIGRVSIQ